MPRCVSSAVLLGSFTIRSKGENWQPAHRDQRWNKLRRGGRKNMKAWELKSTEQPKKRIKDILGMQLKTAQALRHQEWF